MQPKNIGLGAENQTPPAAQVRDALLASTSIPNTMPIVSLDTECDLLGRALEALLQMKLGAPERRMMLFLAGKDTEMEVSHGL